jgi:nucleotide-binding universal stress UspA family protein
MPESPRPTTVRILAYRRGNCASSPKHADGRSRAGTSTRQQGGLGKALGLRTKRLQETVTKKLKRWRYEIRLFLRCVHGSAQTEVRQLPLVGDEETKMAANQDLVIVGGRGHVGVLQSLLGKSRSARTKMKAPGVKP